MRISDLRDEIAEHVRSQKEGRLATLHTPDARTDVPGMVHGYRGEEPVVMMMPKAIDRDASLVAARIQATAFGCDTIALTSESWHPAREHMEINPFTGKRWAETKASMQTAAQEHDALAKGVLIECLMTTVVNRAGDVSMLVQDYEILRHRNALGILSYAIEWHEPQVIDSGQEGAKLSGIIPEALVAFMNEPTLAHALARTGLSGADFGLTEVETQAHQDCATVKHLLRLFAVNDVRGFEGAIVLLSDNDKRTEIIDKSLGQGGFGLEVFKP